MKLAAKYEGVKMKPKRSSIRNRLGRKSGIIRLSEEMCSVKVVDGSVGDS